MPVLRMGRRMGDAEAMLWAAERDPVLRSAFLNLTICDQPLDIVRFRRRMALIVDSFPRLRQRAATSLVGPPWWEDDRDFDLDHHVRHVALAAPGSDRQLLELAADLLDDAFDPTRPLWRFLVVEGLSGGRGALLAKLHHTAIDGAGGIRMAGMFVDHAADEDHPALPAAASDETGPTDHLAVVAEVLGRQIDALDAAAQLIRHSWRDPFAAARAVAGLVQIEGSRSQLWRRRGARRQLEVLSFDLARVELAAKRLGGSVDDLFVSALCDAAGAYHRARCVEVGDLRVAVPSGARPRRAADACLPARVLLPCGEQDAEARFSVVHDRLEQARQAAAPGLVDTTTGVLSVVPPPIVARLARHQTSTIDFAASSLRGAPVEQWIAGARIRHSHPMGPTGGTAFLATVLSRGGTLDLGLCCDRTAVLDPAELRGRIASGFAALGC